MTTGAELGTNGLARAERRAWLTVLCVGVAVALVNATSGIMEGDGEHWVEPVLWETTSALVIIGLAPLIGYAMRRWPPGEDHLPTFAPIHFGLTIPFSLAHVAFIFVVCEAAYWAVGARYGFFDDGVAITLLYEWRKDVLVYAAIAVTYWVFQSIAQRQQAAPNADGRIEIRDGAAAVFLSPADILFVEAAGNYVEFHTHARTHLVRGTLASWELQLNARGFARVHRSRLVNRARITQIKPTPSGDVEITLDNGSALAGSRRYRAAMEAPAR